MRSILIGQAALVAAAFVLHAAPAAAQGADCAAADGAEFICGVKSVEQLIYAGDSGWAIGSSLGGGVPLYLFNLQTEEIEPLDPAAVDFAPDTQAFPDCPQQPDIAAIQSLGVDLKEVNGRNLLSVVDHNGNWLQEFSVDLSAGKPKLTWLGCVGMPRENLFPDAVVALPDGGLVLTSLFDTNDDKMADKLRAKEPYGNVYVWHAEDGWKEIAQGDVSGPNGIIRSEDGGKLYIADWGGHGVVTYDIATGESSRVDTDFFVDNITWSEDGTKILLGGQYGEIEGGFACFASSNANCPEVNFKVEIYDPATGTITPVFGPGHLGEMGAGSGALQHGDTLWLTTFRGDRIAKIPMPK